MGICYVCSYGKETEDGRKCLLFQVEDFFLLSTRRATKIFTAATFRCRSGSVERIKLEIKAIAIRCGNRKVV